MLTGGFSSSPLFTKQNYKKKDRQNVGSKNRKATETYELTRASSYGLEVVPSSSGTASSAGGSPALEVLESTTSSLFLLFPGETAEGRERVDSLASDSTSLSKEAADL
jgi:hypothetical protein